MLAVTSKQLAQVDAALALYFSFLFKAGYGAAKLRFAMYGYVLYCTNLDINRTRPFPRASRVLKGRVNSRPGESFEPWPEFVVYAIFHQSLLDEGWRVAGAAAIQYDS